MTWSRKVLKKGSDNANLCVCVCVCVCVRTRDERRVPQALRGSSLLHHGTSPIWCVRMHDRLWCSVLMFPLQTYRASQAMESGVKLHKPFHQSGRKSEFSPSQDHQLPASLISELGVLLGKYVYWHQRYPGNTWRALQLWGQACCIRESGCPQMAGRIPRGQEGKECSSGSFCSLSASSFSTSSPWKPWKQRVTLHLKPLLVYKAFEHDRITPSQVNCFASFNNFIMWKSMLKDLNATEDRSSRVGIHPCLELSLKTFLYTFHFLAQFYHFYQARVGPDKHFSIWPFPWGILTGKTPVKPYGHRHSLARGRLKSELSTVTKPKKGIYVTKLD